MSSIFFKVPSAIFTGVPATKQDNLSSRFSVVLGPPLPGLTLGLSSGEITGPRGFFGGILVSSGGGPSSSGGLLLVSSTLPVLGGGVGVLVESLG